MEDPQAEAREAIERFEPGDSRELAEAEAPEARPERPAREGPRPPQGNAESSQFSGQQARGDARPPGNQPAHDEPPPDTPQEPESQF